MKNFFYAIVVTLGLSSCVHAQVSTSGTGFGVDITSAVNVAIANGDIDASTGPHTTGNDDAADLAVAVSTAALETNKVDRAGDTVTGSLVVNDVTRSSVTRISTDGSKGYEMSIIEPSGFPVVLLQDIPGAGHLSTFAIGDESGGTPFFYLVAGNVSDDLSCLFSGGCDSLRFSSGLSGGLRRWSIRTIRQNTDNNTQAIDFEPNASRDVRISTHGLRVTPGGMGGTALPTHTLDIDGTASIRDQLNVDSHTVIAGDLTVNNDLLVTNDISADTGTFRNNATFATDSGRVGIGTTDPNSALHIAASGPELGDVTVDGKIFANSNGQANPPYTFVEETGSGIFRGPAGVINFGTLGSTDVKVSNSGLEVITGDVTADAFNGAGATFASTKENDEDISSSTALQDDDDLQFSAIAFTTNTVNIHLRWTSNGGAFKFGLNCPAGSELRASWNGSESSSSNFIDGEQTTLDEGDILADASATNRNLNFHAEVLVGATSGTCAFRWAQETSNAADTSVLEGSQITVVRLGGEE